MLIAIATLNAFIFIALSGFHFFWAAGGRGGKLEVLPTFENSSEKLFMPSVFSALVVAFGLLLFAIAALGAMGFFYSMVDLKYFLWANLVIGIIFLARAVGDFRYIGFAKRVKDSAFAKNDTKYFSPISALLSLNSFLIYVLG